MKTDEQIKNAAEHGVDQDGYGGVHNSEGQSFYKWMVESSLLVPQDDWPLIEQCWNLRHARESVEQHSEEENAASGEERASVN